MLKEPVNLNGVKVVDAKYMKQSKLMRYTIELTEQDTKRYAGVLGMFQPLEIVSNISIKPLGSEGEDHGHEPYVDHEDEYRM